MNEEDLLRGIGRANEEQARVTRYVIAIGFIAVVVATLFVG